MSDRQSWFQNIILVLIYTSEQHPASLRNRLSDKHHLCEHIGVLAVEIFWKIFDRKIPNKGHLNELIMK